LLFFGLFWGLVWPEKIFSCTKHDKKNKLWTFLNPMSINSYRFRCNFTEKTGKIGILVFEKMFKKHMEKTFLYQKAKTAFRISRISLKIYMSVYDYLYSLDSKVQRLFFYYVLSRKKILASLGPKTSDKKN
jgi:hypothetical protein